MLLIAKLGLGFAQVMTTTLMSKPLLVCPRQTGSKRVVRTKGSVQALMLRPYSSGITVLVPSVYTTVYEPILVTVQETTDSIFVWVTNEANQEFDKRLTINWNNFEGKSFVKDDKDIKIRANSSRAFWSASKKMLFGTLSANEGYFNAFLSTKDQNTNEEGESTTTLFAKAFTLKLPKDQIKTSFIRYITEGPQKFTVRSKVYVRQVMFTSDDPTAQFSNNGFDLLPNVSYTIEVLSATNAGTVEKTLKVNSLNRLITDANYKTEVGEEN